MTENTSALKKNKPPSLSKPQSFVTITAGAAPDAQTFVVHKELLCYHSPFFAAAFNNDNFVEGSTQAMKLEDVEGPVFGLMISWLYTKQIEDDEDTEAAKEEGLDQTIGLAKSQPFRLRLAKLWTLAERFLVPTLQNAAAETLLVQIRKGIVDQLKGLGDYIYAVEDDNSLRRMVVHLFAYSSNDNPFIEMVDELPDRMVKDVAKVLKGFYGRSRSYDMINLNSAKAYYVKEEVKEKT